MVTKTITITEDAYKLLKESKKPSESFSEFFKRRFARTRVSDILGYLKEGDAEQMKAELKKWRKKASKDWEDRNARLGQLSND